MAATHSTRLVSTLFSPTATDALRLKLATIQAHARFRQFIGQLPQFPTIDDWEDDRRLLDSTDTYWWTEETASVVAQASASYPLDAQNGDLYVPTLHRAFCAFQSPVIFIEIEGRRIGLSALAWCVGHRMQSLGDAVLIIRGYARFTDYQAMIEPVFYVDDDRRDLEDKQLQAERDACTRWILTASMFVEQRLLVPSDNAAQHHIQRQARKEAERKGMDPTVRVVQLRRANNARAASTTDEEKEWSCRWLVQGHWRNQWYGKAKRHVPRWIAPYVKGPDDKPMKAPAPTVFAVNR